MSTRRLLIVHFLILFVIAGSLYDIATKREHWPFSNYPMFSTVHRRPTLTWLRLFGVTADKREIALLSYNELWPLEQSWLPLGLRRIADSPNSGSRLHDAIADVMLRYNTRQARGEIISRGWGDGSTAQSPPGRHRTDCTLPLGPAVPPSRSDADRGTAGASPVS